MGADAIPRLDGEQVKDFKNADEMVVNINGSKVDQCNVGTLRNLYRTGDEVCPVAALEEMDAAFPGRRERDAAVPLFRKQSGEVVRRQEVRALLGAAAQAQGIPASRMGSHSLRIGGATAMYHADRELEAIKRFGRWASSAFHVYLWEAHDAQQDLAQSMVRDTFTLTAVAPR